MRDFTTFRNVKVNMKKLLSFVLFFGLCFSSYGQDYITDKEFEDAIHEKSPFGDDEVSIIIVEFWAKFNDANAFKDWDKLEGVTHYYRCDIAVSPNAKKDYRVRMAPTLIIFKDGIKEETFKAGLDLECPVDLEELQETIDELKKASQF
tara:strand:+ start:1517 stop:1963 length:447 start_codon:yes stop_codon:yes gene_type:complete